MSQDRDASAPTIPEARSLRFLFRGQLLHAGAAVLLAATAWALAAPALGDGSWLGVSDVAWFWAVIGLSVGHQVYVWLSWRTQLGWGLLTRAFGRYDLAVHAAIFGPMMLARVFLVIAVGLADPSSLLLPRWLQLALGVGLLVPTLYTLWSVARYFGIRRAMGADHFRASYRTGGLVDEGAFAWTPNAMYTFALLGLWSIGFLLDSQAALVAAIFKHAFVWAHYLGTEEPDMELIYGE